MRKQSKCRSRARRKDYIKRNMNHRRRKMKREHRRRRKMQREEMRRRKVQRKLEKR